MTKLNTDSFGISFAVLSTVCRDFTIRQSPHSQAELNCTPKVRIRIQNRNKFKLFNKHCNNTVPNPQDNGRVQSHPNIIFFENVSQCVSTVFSVSFLVLITTYQFHTAERLNRPQFEQIKSFFQAHMRKFYRKFLCLVQKISMLCK